MAAGWWARFCAAGAASAWVATATSPRGCRGRVAGGGWRMADGGWRMADGEDARGGAPPLLRAGAGGPDQCAAAGEQITHLSSAVAGARQHACAQVETVTEQVWAGQAAQAFHATAGGIEQQAGQVIDAWSALAFRANGSVRPTEEIIDDLLERLTAGSDRLGADGPSELMAGVLDRRQPARSAARLRHGRGPVRTARHRPGDRLADLGHRDQPDLRAHADRQQRRRGREPGRLRPVRRRALPARRGRPGTRGRTRRPGTHRGDPGRRPGPLRPDHPHRLPARHRPLRLHARDRRHRRPRRPRGHLGHLADVRRRLDTIPCSPTC